MSADAAEQLQFLHWQVYICLCRSLMSSPCLVKKYQNDDDVLLVLLAVPNSGMLNSGAPGFKETWMRSAVLHFISHDLIFQEISLQCRYFRI